MWYVILTVVFMWNSTSVDERSVSVWICRRAKGASHFKKRYVHIDIQHIKNIALYHLNEFHLINLTNCSINIYIKNRGIMLPVPFTFISYLHSVHIPITLHKNYAYDIIQNSFKFFDELACRPECRLMRVCSAKKRFGKLYEKKGSAEK